MVGNRKTCTSSLHQVQCQNEYMYINWVSPTCFYNQHKSPSGFSKQTAHQTLALHSIQINFWLICWHWKTEHTGHLLFDREMYAMTIVSFSSSQLFLFPATAETRRDTLCKPWLTAQFKLLRNSKRGSATWEERPHSAQIRQGHPHVLQA